MRAPVQNLGLGFGLIYDYRISPSIALGVSANYTIGTLNKISITANRETSELELPKDNKENLSRLNFGGGIRFYF